MNKKQESKLTPLNQDSDTQSEQTSTLAKQRTLTESSLKVLIIIFGIIIGLTIAIIIPLASKAATGKYLGFNVRTGFKTKSYVYGGTPPKNIFDRIASLFEEEYYILEQKIPTPIPLPKAPIAPVVTLESNFTYQESITLTPEQSTELAFTLEEKNRANEMTGIAVEHRYFDYNKNTGDLVYIVENNKGLRQVFYLKSNANSPQLLYELQNQGVYDSYVTVGISGVKISPSGKKIAIGTYNSLFIYDTNTQQLQPVFFKNPDYSQGSPFAYMPEQFSPDEKLLGIRQGFYESTSDFLVNIETGQEYHFETAKSGLIHIVYVGDNRVFTTRQGIHEKQNLVTYILEEHSIDTNESEQITTLYGEHGFGMLGNIIDGNTYKDTVFFVTNKQGPEIISNESSKIYTTLDELTAFNINTKQTKILLSFGSNPSNIFTSSRIGTIFSIDTNTEPQIGVKLLKGSRSEAEYLLVAPNAYNSVTPLVLTLEENE